MIKKVKKIIKKYLKLQEQSNLQLKELEWAHIYHDSIRGKYALQNLPLNIGRWAGNYAFFYILNRILSDFKLQRILEFGLGESTKFISTFIDNYHINSHLLTVEHDSNWKDLFLSSFNLTDNAKIKIHDLKEKEVNGYKSKGYNLIENKIKEVFDLYIVDGPFGSDNYSRYDIVSLLKNVSKNDDFIIIMDDYHRLGEQQTVEDILKLLKNKDISVFTKEYIGNKSVFVITTSKYKYVTSM
ncbi:hypothetical protein [uncultured Lacinutrix sp.]|uniref:hypothetical protein n=1 Tax=uncultured Lacinutrix sp. TaxID=574032 RepID=UPI00261CFCD1|nr:hypothetical protein [uncultured Lacinutrix sp.]